MTGLTLNIKIGHISRVIPDEKRVIIIRDLGGYQLGKGSWTFCVSDENIKMV